MFPQYIDSTYTNREDGRFLSTYGYVLSLLEKTKPQLAYNPVNQSFRTGKKV